MLWTATPGVAFLSISSTLKWSVFFTSLLNVLRQGLCISVIFHYSCLPSSWHIVASQWWRFNCSVIFSFAALWTVAYQAPLSMEFSRQEYSSELPFPTLEIFPTHGSNPDLLHCRHILHCWVTREAQKSQDLQHYSFFIPLFPFSFQIPSLVSEQPLITMLTLYFSLSKTDKNHLVSVLYMLTLWSYTILCYMTDIPDLAF